jgi:predicted transcriptional regulator
VLTIGPRQLDVLRLLCEHGPATARQLLRWLATDPPIAYQTMMTVCVRLAEKGLVERRLAASADETVRYGKAYIYTPLVGDAAELQHANAVPEPTVAAWEARARQAEL